VDTAGFVGMIVNAAHACCRVGCHEGTPQAMAIAGVICRSCVLPRFNFFFLLTLVNALGKLVFIE